MTGITPRYLICTRVHTRGPAPSITPSSSFQCSLCKKNYSRRDRLGTHMRNVHNDESCQVKCRLECPFSHYGDSQVTDYFSTKGIQWRFKVERAPWWGGIFERMIQSAKRCLRKIVRNARLTNEELMTAVIEVEMIVNSRPLSYVSSEELEQPLTPSHLLYGY